MLEVIQKLNLFWVVPLYYVVIAPYLYLRHKDIRIIRGTTLHKLLEKCVGEIKYD